MPGRHQLTPTGNESRQLSQSTPESKAQEFSVKDASLNSVSSSASTATSNPENSVEKLANMPLVKSTLNSLADKNEPSVNFYATSSTKLLSALENEDALRSLLANAPGGSPKLADKTIAKMKDAVLHEIGTSMYKQVQSKAEDAQKFIKPLVDNATSRETFLTTITTESKGDPQFIQASLQAVGYSEKDAQKLANTLAPMHNGSFDSKALASAQKELQKVAKGLNSELGRLSGGMVSNIKNNNRFLTDPTFENVKSNVLNSLASRCESVDQAETLGKIINEATTASGKADFKENVQIAVLMGTVTFATGGLGAGLGGVALGTGLGVMGSAPEVIQAIAAPDRLQASANLDFTSQQNAQNAVTDRNITLGKTLAFAVIGAAASTVAGASKAMDEPVTQGTKALGKLAMDHIDTITDVSLPAFELGIEYMKID